MIFPSWLGPQDVNRRGLPRPDACVPRTAPSKNSSNGISSVGKTACRYVLAYIVTFSACSPIGGPDGPVPEASRRRALEYGVLALESGDYRTAIDRIAPVAAICPTDRTGRSAMLLLASMELDPRHEAGRPQAAAELAAFQLARRSEGEWEGALAAQIYTLALDHGAQPIAAEDVPGVDIIWSRYLAEPVSAGAPIGIAAPDSVATPETVAMAAARNADVETARVTRAADGGPLCDVQEPVRDLVMPQLTREPLASRSAPAGPQQGGAARPAPTGESRELQAEVDRLRAELARKEQELDRIRRTLRP